MGPPNEQVPDWLSDRLVVFPTVVDPQTCDRIVALGDALPFVRGPLHNEKTGERYFDEHVRVTNVSWFHERDWLFELMQSYARRVNEAWGFDLTDNDPMQFAVYRRGDFFEWHKDMLRVRRETIRKLSVVLQLSERASYRGGALEFLDNDRGVYVPDGFAERGSVAVFATLLKHRVTPVKEGERRSLTAWFKGPPFR